MVDTPGTRLSCNDFEAWVVVDGQELKQYGVECNALTRTPETSCWIPSETGKAFSIKYYRKKVDEYDYATSVYLDGHLVAMHATLIKTGSAIRTISHIRTSSTTVRNFIFGSLELTDDDTLLENPFSSGNIGEIKVVFEQVKATLSNDNTLPPTSVPKTGKVHERSKKGLAHQVKYNEPCHNEYKGRVCNFVKYEVLATLIFKYRPLAMLQATGIVPRMAVPRLHQMKANLFTHLPLWKLPINAIYLK
ncbi:hypothetical protein BDZ97DRAFT_1016540 [Flammula alnicola]|nr:hypothetical protein BDZ97DRAFT_1016540 [Flammula alnicola]